MVEHFSIRSYVKEAPRGNAANDEAWLNKGEIPASIEISGAGADENPEEELDVQPNKVAGQWSSKDEYLRDHYNLLREDAIAPLRDAVFELRAEPNIMESDSVENASIYEKVCFPIGYYLTTAKPI